MRDRTRARIVVVGAGLSGLGAAWKLRGAGADVSVLERGGEPGGRCAGSWVEGFSIDRALRSVSSRDRELPAWIEELELGEEILPVRPLQLAQVEAGRIHRIGAPGPRGALRTPGIGWRDGLRLLRFSRLMRRYSAHLDLAAPERAAHWDDRSVADFARLYFGPRCLERWIGPEAVCFTQGDENEMSRVAFLLNRLQGHPGLPRGSLHDLARRAAGRLSVRFGVEAQSIEVDAPRRLVVHCRTREGSRARLEADAVLLAVASTDAARIAEPLLVSAESDFLQGVRWAPSVTLAAALEAPASQAAQLVRVPRAEGSSIEAWISEPGGSGRAPLGSGLLTLEATGRFGRLHATSPDEVLEKELLAALERFLPGSLRALRFTRLTRAERAAPLFEVGAYRALARFARIQRDRRAQGRRLYFAGDYLGGPSPENALVSGRRAAAALLEDIA